jgi:hypothetical protein
MHRQDRSPIAASNDEVSAFARFEYAPLPSEKPLAWLLFMSEYNTSVV